MALPWVFDVDGCLIDSLTMSSLRPGAADLLRRLRRSGHPTHLWSAGGEKYARDRACEHGIVALFDGFHAKDERDGNGRYIPAFLASPEGAVFVDDRPEDMPLASVVVAVAPYLVHNPFDRALLLLFEGSSAL